MHRKVRRVPLDFDWPQGKPWEGYMLDVRGCPDPNCRHGYSPDGEFLSHMVHVILTAASSPDHPWVRNAAPGQLPDGTTLHELTEGLAGRSGNRMFGHDGIDNFAATRKIVEAAGLQENWGYCPTCEGHNTHPDDREKADSWKHTDPPSGEGWQLWETVSEGSPDSPVFATSRELARWASETGYTVRPGVTLSFVDWLDIIDNDKVGLESAMIF